MANRYRTHLGWVVSLLALTGAPLGHSQELQPGGGSEIVLGTGNTWFADGSRALDEGRVTEGIRLTLEGFKSSVDPFENAAAHSNLCGGYALLRQWAEALEHCDTAIALDASNWHSYNNRAAIYAARGQYGLALADLRHGLELAPQSSTLLKSLAVVEHNQRVLNKRDSATLRS